MHVYPITNPLIVSAPWLTLSSLEPRGLIKLSRGLGVSKWFIFSDYLWGTFYLLLQFKPDKNLRDIWGSEGWNNRHVGNVLKPELEPGLPDAVVLDFYISPSGISKRLCEGGGGAGGGFPEKERSSFTLLSKWHLLPITRTGSLSTAACYILASKLLRKTQRSQTLDGIMLYLRREETEQDQLQEWAPIPHGQWVIPSSWHRPIDPFCAVAEGLHFFSSETHIAVGLARCHMTHMVKHNKGTHIDSETGKDTNW